MKKQQIEALRKIKDAHPTKLLHPKNVVRAAAAKSSPLHTKFTWDNSKAALEYRLWQARELIAQYWVVEAVSQHPIRMWISMKSDRKAGGYRDHQDVLKNPARRREWLKMALDDLAEWERTYGALSELAPVFKALNRVRGTI